VQIRALELSGVRNLAPLRLAPSPRFNVFHGDNGQGKTNLLETIYVVGALRSFRTARLAELIAFGAAEASISARLVRGGLERVYEVGIAPKARRVRLDGKAVRPVSRYFGDFNVVLFAPEDLQVPRGTPADRRRFLDRAVFNRRAAHLQVAQDYDKALRSRNAILREIAEGRRALRSAEDLFAAFDIQIAGLGAQVIAARRHFLDELAPRFAAAFESITQTGITVGLRYQCTVPLDGCDEPALTGALAAALADSQRRDLARGATSVGPHRDDLAFDFDGREASAFASQGQLRALVLAWKTAEMDLLAATHGEAPILLLDDVSSELDETRNAYLFEFLRSRVQQCFITTTHARHVLAREERVDYRVQHGVIIRE
jgi:DNA replication and repair protein RecF